VTRHLYCLAPCIYVLSTRCYSNTNNTTIDETPLQFNEYYGKMPWLAIPTDGTAVKNELATTFQLSSIPTTLVLDCKTGNYITDDARDTVAKIASGTKEEGLALVKTWKEMEGVPIDEAAEKRKGEQPKQNPVMALFLYIAKNPMYIFGMLYIYKYLKKTYFPSAGDPIMDDTDAADVMGASEGEF